MEKKEHKVGGYSLRSKIFIILVITSIVVFGIAYTIYDSNKSMVEWDKLHKETNFNLKNLEYFQKYLKGTITSQDKQDWFKLNCNQAGMEVASFYDLTCYKTENGIKKLYYFTFKNGEFYQK